jgi:hypothetical protein
MPYEDVPYFGQPESIPTVPELTPSAGAPLMGLTTYANGAPVTSIIDIKEAGYSFVRQKATEGVAYTDPTFYNTADQAVSAGFPIIPFHYFRPSINPGDQAQYYYSVAGGKVNMPPSVDFETTDYLDPGAALDQLAGFEEESRGLWGSYPSIYTSPSFWNDAYSSYLERARRNGKTPFDFSQVGLNIAQYGVAAPTIPAPFQGASFWQAQKEISNVPGVAGRPDLEYATSGGMLGAGGGGLGGGLLPAAYTSILTNPIIPNPTLAWGGNVTGLLDSIQFSNSNAPSSAQTAKAQAPSSGGGTTPAASTSPLITFPSLTSFIGNFSLPTPAGNVTVSNLIPFALGVLLVIVGLIAIVFAPAPTKGPVFEQIHEGQKATIARGEAATRKVKATITG